MVLEGQIKKNRVAELFFFSLERLFELQIFILIT